jgi:EAL domain-containing protein (putative c-di-GMP-specific phosphodiesterase class I)
MTQNGSPQPLRQLHDAIRTDGLILQFQPTVRLRDSRPIRLEALVRWPSATGARLGPSGVVALAERSGLGHALSSWILRHALARYREWRALGVDDGVVVNVSSRELADAGFARRIETHLTAQSVDPSALTLDLSERALAGVDLWRIERSLRCLARIGVRVALDDCTTEHASLKLLALLPFAELKLDSRAIARMCTDGRYWRLVREAIDFARGRGVEATAEGVEDATTADILDRVGCDVAQGRYMSGIVGYRHASFLRAGELDSATLN